MTGYTPRLGLPYPEADTLITDSAAIVQELAEKIEAAIPDIIAVEPEPSQRHNTVAPYLVADLSVSGTYTIPDLVGDGSPTLWDIVLISGGYPGRQWGSWESSYGGMGGNGGHVRVWRGIKMAAGADFPVTVGGQQTGCAFGPISVLAESGQSQPEPYGVGAEPGYDNTGIPGGDGCTITPAGSPTTYWCGGGGSAGHCSGGPAPGFPGGTGGVGGGGEGGHGGIFNSRQLATNGTGGTTGGGGGGGGGAKPTNMYHGGGSAGRILLYASVPAPTTRIAPTPAMAAAIDDHDVMIGVYAVDLNDPQLPGVHHHHVIPYPDAPIDTGRTATVTVDPDDPDGPTHDVPVMAWPEAGWKYTNNTWEEPK